MREPIRDRERLEHIKEAIERIQANIKDVAMDDLTRNILEYRHQYKKEYRHQGAAERGMLFGSLSDFCNEIKKMKEI